MNKDTLRIGLDLDDVLAGFWQTYCKRFNTNRYPNRLREEFITRNVQRILRKDKEFWTTLPKINEIDFEPTLYCTKRVNKKSWSREWLLTKGFPNKPIYQIYTQERNKADIIKGRVDVFIDDSLYNVCQMNAAGVPAILFGKTHPNCVSVFSLKLDEIYKAYLQLMRRNGY